MKIKRPYKLKKRNDRGGKYYMIRKDGGKTEALNTTDKDKAIELADAICGVGDNENAMHHMKVAEAHLMKCNPEWITNTWDEIAKRLIAAPNYFNSKTKGGNTTESYTSAWKNKCWNNLRNKRCIDTVPRDFELALKGVGPFAIEFGKKLHNYAVKRSLIPYPVMGVAMWPKYESGKMSATMTEETHLKLIKLIQDENLPTFVQFKKYSPNSTRKQWRDEWENWLWFLWWTGASSKDAANMQTANIDWTKRIIKFNRSKTSSKSIVKIGRELEALLKKLPKKGYLFPLIQKTTSSNRARLMGLWCDWIGTKRVTIHGYRFSFAERAKEAGMSTEDRMTTLGHKTAAMATHYDEGVDHIPQSIEIIDGGLKAA